jgi:small subunit ribosomal protein S4e
MSRKGENKKSKAISAPKAVHINRKDNFWSIRTKAGPHTKETSMPLGLVIRDFAKVVSTLKEAKHALQKGEVKVNGKVRRDHQLPVGLFDVVSIEKQKVFLRVVYDAKGRLTVKLSDKDLKEKVSRVVKKVMNSKGVQITTNDGRTFLGIKANVGDSVKLKLPEGKAESVLEYKAGAVAYVTKGAHSAQIATIKEIVEGTARRAQLVKLVSGKTEFETVAENVFVIGKTKSELEDMQ